VTIDGEAVIRRFYEEVWNRWRLDVADEIVALNVRFRGTLGTRAVGIDAFKEYVTTVRAAFPDWTNRIDELISADDTVVARIRCAGTHEGEIFGIAPTGRRVAYDAVAIFHLEEEQIAEAWVVGDTQELWRALGVAPSPA
jgi:predicted ester cyclase